METVEVVIKMPKDIYESFNESFNNPFDGMWKHYLVPCAYAIRNGTVLPKGHGVLKDVTNLMRGLYTDMQTIEETFMSGDVYKMIDEECPTVIEADKEVSDADSN